MINDRLSEQQPETHVILSVAAQSAAESKNLRRTFVLSSVSVRRSFDSLRSLRMTGAVGIGKINDHLS